MNIHSTQINRLVSQHVILSESVVAICWLTTLHEDPLLHANTHNSIAMSYCQMCNTHSC